MSCKKKPEFKPPMRRRLHYQSSTLHSLKPPRNRFKHSCCSLFKLYCIAASSSAEQNVVILGRKGSLYRSHIKTHNKYAAAGIYVENVREQK